MDDSAALSHALSQVSRSNRMGHALRRTALLVLAATALIASGGSALAQAVDDFAVDQATISNNTTTPAGSTVSGAGILGGERDLVVTDNSPGGFPASIGVSGGELTYVAFQSTSEARAVWDGADADATTLDPTGLASVDLTAGGSANAFVVTVNMWSNAPSIDFLVHTDGANSSELSLLFPGSAITTPTVFTLPFADFSVASGTGADFTDVGAIEVIFSATFDDIRLGAVDTGLQAPSLSATKADSLVDDLDGDGLAGPGDTVRYNVQVVNSGTADATGVVFTATPSGDSPLDVGTVTTTQGSVVTGNTAGDMAVLVDLGTLAAGGGSATITFDVVVADPLPGGVAELSCQGVVTGNELSDLATDDPDTPAAGDPTITPLAVPAQPGPLEIPTASTLGLLLLTALLAGFGIWRTRTSG